MKNILVLAGTTHRHSINRALAKAAASQVSGANLVEIDLNDFEMPIYSQDREEADGIPQKARDFLAAIQACDGVVLSLAEHNGSYTAAFKNVLDWTSRQERELWSGQPMLLLATSPGGRGGSQVLSAAEQYFPHLGAQIVATFSLPSFDGNFSKERGVLDGDLKAELTEKVARFQAALESSNH